MGKRLYYYPLGKLESKPDGIFDEIDGYIAVDCSGSLFSTQSMFYHIVPEKTYTITGVLIIHDRLTGEDHVISEKSQTFTADTEENELYATPVKIVHNAPWFNENGYDVLFDVESNFSIPRYKAFYSMKSEHSEISGEKELI